MRKKRINYDEIINKLDDYLKKKNDKYMIVVTSPSGTGYKIQESDGEKLKEFYINTDKELEDYLKEKKDNKKCSIINVNIIE